MNPHGSFVWTDVSTFSLTKATRFYSKVLGWSLSDDGSGYHFASTGRQPYSGLYEMPAFFQKIKMPSFWMSYIAVDNVDEVAAKAKHLGAKVELKETNAIGKIALIRDPLGAGFTCYEGEQASACGVAAGQWSGSELYISDITKVQHFYSELFRWDIQRIDESEDFSVCNSSGVRVATIHEADTASKGDKEYWAVIFRVNDLNTAATAITRAGGEVLTQDAHQIGAYDDQGAYFILRRSEAPHREPALANPTSSPFKWRSILGLVIVYAAVLTEANWMWGLLFLIWVLPDLKSGTTYFLDPIGRDKHPFLYWATIGTWLLLIFICSWNPYSTEANE